MRFIDLQSNSIVGKRIVTPDCRCQCHSSCYVGTWNYLADTQILALEDAQYGESHRIYSYAFYIWLKVSFALLHFGAFDISVRFVCSPPMSCFCQDSRTLPTLSVTTFHVISIYWPGASDVFSGVGLLSFGAHVDTCSPWASLGPQSTIRLVRLPKKRRSQPASQRARCLTGCNALFGPLRLLSDREPETDNSVRCLCLHPVLHAPHPIFVQLDFSTSVLLPSAPAPQEFQASFCTRETGTSLFLGFVSFHFVSVLFRLPTAFVFWHLLLALSPTSFLARARCRRLIQFVPNSVCKVLQYHLFHLFPVERSEQIHGPHRRRTNSDPGEAGTPTGGCLSMYCRQWSGRSCNRRHASGCTL